MIIYTLSGSSPYRDDDETVHCAVRISEEKIEQAQASFERWGYYNLVVKTEES
jgi:hypothetical protein